MTRLLRIAIVLVIAGVAFGAWLYRDLHAPVAHAKASDYIEIPRGSTPEGIADKLVAEGVLRHKWPLLLYLKTTGKAKALRSTIACGIEMSSLASFTIASLKTKPVHAATM